MNDQFVIAKHEATLNFGLKNSERIKIVSYLAMTTALDFH